MKWMCYVNVFNTALILVKHFLDDPFHIEISLKH